MPDPAVVVTMRRFKRDLLAREAGHMQIMARRWLQVEKALRSEIDVVTLRLARDIEVYGADAVFGQPFGKVRQIERLERLALQAQQEFEKYIAFADGKMATWQQEMIELGINQSAQATALSLVSYGMGGLDFGRINVEALEYMVGMTGDGQPLGDLLRQRMILDANGVPLPDVLPRLIDTLTNAVAMGWGPEKTARMMVGDLREGLQKAFAIARSEQMRVYREASRAQYEESGVVDGHARLCNHDSRVCLGCLADEGKWYPLSQAISDHVQGRCTGVPAIKNMPKPEWLAGQAWFDQQSPERQRQIMGQTRLDAYKAGDVRFDQMGRTQQNATWGPSPQVTAIRDLGLRPPVAPMKPSAPVVSPEPSVPPEQSLPPAAARLQALSRIQDQIKSIRDHEEMFVIDEKGGIVFQKSGGAANVRISEDEMQKMHGMTMIHNHPSNTRGISFSPQDIDVAMMSGLIEIRAVGAERTFKMVIPQGLSEAQQLNLRYRALQIQTEMEVLWREEIRAGTLSIHNANENVHHEIWKRWVDTSWIKELGFVYDFWGFRE